MGQLKGGKKLPFEIYNRVRGLLGVLLVVLGTGAVVIVGVKPSIPVHIYYKNVSLVKTRNRVFASRPTYIVI